ncbi:NAD(P)-dependent oxidoreductase [Limoniibacter endophyticus]|uniref:3-beta hydroxysteroid dehydrogenase n=1 Tax=Limoniibacter endophyticus TaxID=1565040 RepID=A0A8J3DM83_9HYPH|nr:NAD(P)-dependent oxidoreductase [Limoniibacter endophyticus]GHC69821.1 3-beta hydroxysteroid dehydrogenase [Limoniibacter endophyticus]
MAKVALVGASGNVGSRLLRELSSRGHSITAIARNPEKIETLEGVTATKGDLNDAAALGEVLKGHEIVISSVHFSATDPDKLLSAVRASGAKRYLVVGGAGSLEVAPGKRLVDQPGFPAAYFNEASKGAAYLDMLRNQTDLDWTFLSPSAEFVAGERTGNFRLGQDTLLTDENGRSWISYEDFAIALVDEIQTPKHRGVRFTVGY